MEEVEKIDDNFKVVFCGSYRRGDELSDTIDILITHPTLFSSLKAMNKEELDEKREYIFMDKKSPKHLLHNVVTKLVKDEFIVDTFTFGESRFIVIF